MIRISKPQSADQGTMIRVDGRLDQDSLPALLEALAGCRLGPALTIDLSGLTSLDQEARTFLVGIRGAGCTLAGSSLYITQLLKEVAP